MSASASWTRLAFLAHGQNRSDADNRATLAGQIRIKPPAGDRFAIAKTRAGAVLDGMCAAMTRPGVAIVAVDRNGGVAGTLSLSGKSDTINAAVIGRHGRCDLYLTDDESLSLRHAIVLVDEHGGFRITDLRTGGKMTDAAGRRIDGVASADNALLGLGDHVIVARARRSADDAGPMRSPWLPPMAIGTGVADTTSGEWVSQGSVVVGGVTRTGNALLTGTESTRAKIELAHAGAREIWPVGRRALTNGILLGRYERCDGHGSAILARRGISRVHALMIEIDRAPFVIDLASTNGTWIRERDVRVSRLEGGVTFRMGEHGPSITWRPPD
jgi:hypothetical protein